MLVSAGAVVTTTWAARSAHLRVSVRKWCGPRGFRDHSWAARGAHFRVPARGRCGPRAFGDEDAAAGYAPSASAMRSAYAVAIDWITAPGSAGAASPCASW